VSLLIETFLVPPSVLTVMVFLAASTLTIVPSNSLAASADVMKKNIPSQKLALTWRVVDTFLFVVMMILNLPKSALLLRRWQLYPGLAIPRRELAGRGRAVRRRRVD
jgi:hypothetical protein